VKAQFLSESGATRKVENWLLRNRHVSYNRRIQGEHRGPRLDL
jgi:hypothetical protein